MRRTLFHTTALAGLAAAVLTLSPALADSYDHAYGSGYYSGRSVDDVRDAQRMLINASVKDDDGDTVGYVQDVSTDGDGDIRTVDVALRDTGTVAPIPADDLRFDRDGDTVRADLSGSQIRSMADRSYYNDQYDDSD